MICIKKTAHITLFWAAGLFLLLHNLTPHFHAESGSDWAMQSEKSTSDSPFDWLTDIFGIDLGEGHLECFSIQKEQLVDAGAEMPDLQPDFYSFDIDFMHATQRVSFHYIGISPTFFTQQAAIPDDSHTHAFRLRGPPHRA